MNPWATHLYHISLERGMTGVVYGYNSVSIWGGAVRGCNRKSCDRKRPCPEVALTGSRFCVCPAFSRAYFLVVLPWLPDVTEGHLTLSGFPWVCVTGSCATFVVVVNNVGWGCSLWRPRPIMIGNSRVLYLVTGTSPGYLPLLFSYSV